MLPRKDRCGKTQLAQFNNFSNILLIISIMAEIMQIYMFLSCCGRLGTNFRRKTGRGGSVILLKINALSPTVHLFLSRLLFTHSVPNIKREMWLVEIYLEYLTMLSLPLDLLIRAKILFRCWELRTATSSSQTTENWRQILPSLYWCGFYQFI